MDHQQYFQSSLAPTALIFRTSSSIPQRSGPLFSMAPFIFSFCGRIFRLWVMEVFPAFDSFKVDSSKVVAVQCCIYRSGIGVVSFFYFSFTVQGMKQERMKSKAAEA